MDLSIYIIIWILALITFFGSFISHGGTRIILNVISFVLFALLSMTYDVSTSTVIVVDNSIETVKNLLSGTIYLQYISYIFLSITIIRGIQHAYMEFKGD